MASPFTIPLPELDPVSVLQNFNWMRDCHSSNDKDVIAIDGKTLQHSYDKSRRKGAIHVISAFSTTHSLSPFGRLRRMRNPMRLQLFLNILTCWRLKGKLSQLMWWVARKILQRRNPSSYCLRCPWWTYWFYVWMERTEKIMRGSLLSVNNSRTKEGARNNGQILYQFCWFNRRKVCGSDSKSLARGCGNEWRRLQNKKRKYSRIIFRVQVYRH